MASYRAIRAVCEAVIELLATTYLARPEAFGGNQLEFGLYLHRDFNEHTITTGVSLFLYRVVPNGVQRTPAGRLGPNGQRYRPQLSLDLYFLLTAWAREARMQYDIVGWMMRTLEDTPILPAGALNTNAPEVFHAEESVEVGLADMSTEDMLHLWETLFQNEYQLSVPYRARNVMIESTEILTTGRPVQERAFGYGQLPGAAS
jgi:hypothetical protein